jgi:hypothetical protein
VIGFAVSQGANAITVDGIGLHPGATSANPALAPYVTLISILRHVLNNFVFNAWRSQSTYFGDSPMIDATTWDAAEAYAIRQGWTNGLYLTASDVETRAVDLLQDAIRDKGIRFYWTPTGKLAIALRDHSPAAIYTSGARWIDAGQALDPGAIGKRSMQREDVDAVRRGIWRVAAGGDARSTVAIVRPGSSGSIVDTYAGRFGDPRRYMDRNMIAPSMAPFSSTLATPAFGLGQFAGGSGLKDGALVATWNGHSNGVNTRFDWSAAGADRPTLRLGRKNGRAALQFTTNKMDLSHDLSNVITADDHEIWMVFRVASITGADATPYNNHALLRDTNGVMGIFLSLAFGSLPVIQAHGFDGTHRFTSIIEVALNTWSVVRYRHKGGVASCFLWPNTFPSAANRFFETTATLGTITSLTGFPSIGKALSGTYFAGDIAEVLFFNASNLQGINGGQFNGGGYEWEILQTLCHEYGIPL